MTLASPSKAADLLAAGGPFKLSLGGRDTKIPGFLNVDLYEGKGVDIRADISKLDQFPDGSVIEIHASHCLEHFSHMKTMDVLKEWHRVLKPGSIAWIAVPDFGAMVKIYVKFGMSDFMRNFLWGDQIYDLAFHYTGFDFPYLSRQLVQAGFNDVKRVDAFPFGLRDCSTLRDSMFGFPISLNVKAIA